MPKREDVVLKSGRQIGTKVVVANLSEMTRRFARAPAGASLWFKKYTSGNEVGVLYSERPMDPNHNKGRTGDVEHLPEMIHAVLPRIDGEEEVVQPKDAFDADVVGHIIVDGLMLVMGWEGKEITNEAERLRAHMMVHTAWTKESAKWMWSERWEVLAFIKALYAQASNAVEGSVPRIPNMIPHLPYLDHEVHSPWRTWCHDRMEGFETRPAVLVDHNSGSVRAAESELRDAEEHLQGVESGS